MLYGAWLADGAHLNVIGSNFLAKAEVDVEVFRRAALVAVDSKEQARLEAGDFVAAMRDGRPALGGRARARPRPGRPLPRPAVAAGRDAVQVAGHRASRTSRSRRRWSRRREAARGRDEEV